MIERNEGTTAVLFIVPVRHHQTVANWPLAMIRLEETLGSIMRQTSPNWACALVANDGTPLPAIPERIMVVRVNLELMHNEARHVTRDEYHENVRKDKGLRVYAGFRAAPPSDYFMVVDYDDFVHHGLTAYAFNNPGRSGWYIDKGYIYDGGRLVYRCPHGFQNICGTSHLISTKAIPWEPEGSPAHLNMIKRLFGSHRFYKGYFESIQQPLEALPFFGAVYRVGYAGNSSGTGNVMRFVVNPGNLRRPYRLIRDLLRLRLRSTQMSGAFGLPCLD
jgi:hypothetical protein